MRRVISVAALVAMAASATVVGGPSGASALTPYSAEAFPAPVGLVPGNPHKVIKAAWRAFLDADAAPSVLARRLAGESNDAAAAAAKLAAEIDEVRVFVDDAVTRSLRSHGADAADGLSKAAARKALAVTLALNERIGGSIDDTLHGLLIYAKQVRTQRILGGAAPPRFENSVVLLKAIQARSKAQLEAGAGFMWRHPNLDYFSIAESREAVSALLAKLADPAGKASLSTQQLKAVRAAMKSKSPNAQQREIRRLFAGADDSAGKSAGKRGASKGGKTAAQLLADAVRLSNRADTRLGELAAELRPEGVTSQQWFSNYFNPLLNGDLSLRVYPGKSDELLRVLKLKARHTAEATRLNGGTVPDGLNPRWSFERDAIVNLENFFHTKPVRRAGAGAPYYTERFTRRMRDLSGTVKSGSADDVTLMFQRTYQPNNYQTREQLNALYNRYKKDYADLLETLKYSDTALEKEVRAAFLKARREGRLPDKDVVFDPYSSSAPGIYVNTRVTIYKPAEVAALLDGAPRHR